jgi:hypothetical protein
MQTIQNQCIMCAQLAQYHDTSQASATLTGVDICFFGKLMFTLRRSKTADPSVSDFFVHDSARSLYPYGVNPKPCNLAYTPNESGESVSLF